MTGPGRTDAGTPDAEAQPTLPGDDRFQGTAPGKQPTFTTLGVAQP